MWAMRECPSAMRCSVASRATAASSMVRVRTPGIGPPTPTSGLAELVQAGHLGLGELERDGDHRVDPLAQQEVLEHARALAAVARQVVEREVVAAAQELLLGALEHRREEPAVEERDHDADVAGATRGEARRVRRDHVAEACGGLDDLRLRGGRDVAPAAERTRDGRGGDPRELRDLFDAGHGSQSRRCRVLPARPIRGILPFGHAAPGGGLPQTAVVR